MSALRVGSLSKTFGTTRVLHDVDLEVRRGEIHALIGQNGSGKSTLIKILTGFHQADPGAELTIGGEPFDPGAVGASDRARVHVVHQDLALVPSLSAVENLEIATAGGLRRLRRADERDRARRLLDGFFGHIDLDLPVEQLRPHDRAVIAIARALKDVDDTDIVILDEPTASLGAREVDRLFEVLRRLRDRGVGIIYVSHVLQEIAQVGDRVSVLRDGRRVATREAADLTETSMIELMLGADVEAPQRDQRALGAQPVALDVVELTAPNVSGFSLRLRRGEIVGLAGLLGAGCDDVLAALFGASRIVGGTVAVGGAAVSLRNPADAIAAGIALLPADRSRLGLLLEESLAENITLPRLHTLFVRGRLRARAEHGEVVGWLDRMRVNTRDATRRVMSLSGGNQQKVMLGKWLRTEPTVLLLHEPTQAVDVGAKAAIEAAILDVARGGAAIVIASTDADDLARLCDRVIVMRGGAAVAELEGNDLTQHRLLQEIHRTDVGLATGAVGVG